MWSDFTDGNELDDNDLLGVDLEPYKENIPSEVTAAKNSCYRNNEENPQKATDTLDADAKNATDIKEVNEVKDFSHLRGNDRRRARREAGESPLDAFRHGYLWVSDFSRQAWCEQQMEYSYTLPIVLEEDPIMTAGSEFHLAREFAVPDVVTVGVSVTSSEDIWAIKVLNLIEAVDSLSKGAAVRREIPIFGCPYQDGTFVVGLIDEIRVDVETFSFEILELKTRKAKSLPSKAQRVTHDIQVMLYKKLFDDLVKGKLDKESTAKALQLRLDHELGDEISDMASRLPNSPKTLDSLMSYLFERMQGLPFISQCLIEYCYQEDKSTIAIQAVEYDEDWLEKKLKYYLNYWKALRPVEGVDIEDAWKCHRCDFAEVCEWRKRKSEECRSKNTVLQQRKK